MNDDDHEELRRRLAEEIQAERQAYDQAPTFDAEPDLFEEDVQKGLYRRRVTDEVKRRHDLETDEVENIVILSRDEIDALPSPEPFVDGLLMSETVAVISSEGGIGKTATLISIACCAATGRTWLGRRVKPGKTMFVVGEGSAAFSKRLEAWENSQGLMERVQDVHMIRARRITAEFVERLIVLLAGDPDYRMIVFDTFSSLFEVKSENDNSEISNVTRLLHTLKDSIPGLCVVLLHHVTVTMDAKGNRKVKTRGASAFRDNVDTVALLIGTADDFMITTESKHGGKQKDAAPLSLPGLALKAYGDHVTVVHQTPEEQAAHQAEVRRYVEKLNPNVAYTSTELQEDMWVIASKKTYEHIRNQALALGWMVKGDGVRGKYRRTLGGYEGD